MAVASVSALSQGNTQFHFDAYHLDNGMQVVLIPNDRSPVVTQMVWYKTGSSSEPVGQSGLAHYLEHLMFKGTSKFPDDAFSKFIASKGGKENAFTSYDYTAYHQTIASVELPQILEMESDRMRNVIFDPQKIEPERSVIIEERKQRTDNTAWGRFSEGLRASLFVHSPYRLPIIGWEHEIESLTVPQLQSFYNRHYRPGNAILILEGDLPDNVKTLVENTYGKISPVKMDEVPVVKEPRLQGHRRYDVVDEQTSTPYVTINFVVPTFGTAQHPCFSGEKERIKTAHGLEILADLLGGQTSSRLYKNLVVDQKIAISAGVSYQSSTKSCGMLMVYAVPGEDVTNDQLEQALWDQINSVTQTPYSDDEIHQAVIRYIESVQLEKEPLSNTAQFIGSALSTGLSVDEIRQWPAPLHAISSQDIVDLVNNYLQHDRAFTATIRRESK